MKLRADHVAGAVVTLFGVAIIALSGDLPIGQLSMPGSGFMPTIVAVLTIVFGLALIARAAEGPLFSEVSWSDGKHAAMVILITAAAAQVYTIVGFIITMALMIFALLAIIERRKLWRAGVYGVLIVLTTYVGFEYLLRTPLPPSPFSY